MDVSSGSVADHGMQLAAHVLCFLFVVHDGQNGVIAGHGAQHFGEVAVVNGLGGCIGTAGQRFDDHDVLGRFDGDHGVGENAHETVVHAGFRAAGSGIFVRAAGRGYLEQLQLFDITGYRGLRDRKTPRSKRKSQFLLCFNIIMFNDGQDRGLTCILHKRTPPMVVPVNILCMIFWFIFIQIV